MKLIFEHAQAGLCLRTRGCGRGVISHSLHTANGYEKKEKGKKEFEKKEHC